MIKTALVGDIVKFDGHLCKIVSVLSNNGRLCFELKWRNKFGLVPITSVFWDGKKFISEVGDNK